MGAGGNGREDLACPGRPARCSAVFPDAAASLEAMPAGAGLEDAGETAARRARRHKTDQAERKDSIILYKFEALLSWTEFMNLNRRVEDDDFDNAKKAAEDQDEIGLGQLSKAPATRLKLHLDLAPEDVDRDRLAESPPARHHADDRFGAVRGHSEQLHPAFGDDMDRMGGVAAVKDRLAARVV